MPTPRQGYKLANGDRIPSVTTVIGRFKDSSALMFWAFEQGKSGKTRLYEEAEKAADVGTLVHATVEARIKKRQAPTLEGLTPEQQDQAASSFAAYLAWEKSTKLKLIQSEIALVSEKHRYGGTLDGVGIVNKQRCLFDLKTSGAVYTDHLIQLAAYWHLWDENHPDEPITGGAHLLRFAKDHGDFAHHYFGNLEDAWRSFVLMRELYDLDKALKKRAG